MWTYHAGAKLPVSEDPANSSNEIPGEAAATDSGAVSGDSGGAAGREKRSELGLPIALAAWLMPGAGHFLLGRWARGVGILAAVAGLVLTGYAMRGNVFAYRPGDAFGMLGVLADAGSGVFYELARILERGGPDVSRAAGDYGTRFIAAAGIVNVLAVFDAYEIACRRRT